MILKIKSRIFTLVCMTLLFFASTAMAHKVTVFAWVEGNTVFGESKFSGGKKAKGAEVIVRDAQGVELLKTKTDEKGEFSFTVPQKTEMHIELHAGMGHQGKWTIPLEELGEATPAPESSSAPDSAPDPAPGPAPDPAPVADTPPAAKEAAVVPADTAQLEIRIQEIVDKALDQKMRPMMAALADLKQEGPSANDIFGGIGYIFGLMGVAMYFKSRKKQG